MKEQFYIQIHFP